MWCCCTFHSPFTHNSRLPHFQTKHPCSALLVLEVWSRSESVIIHCLLAVPILFLRHSQRFKGMAYKSMGSFSCYFASCHMQDLEAGYSSDFGCSKYHGALFELFVIVLKSNSLAYLKFVLKVMLILCQNSIKVRPCTRSLEHQPGAHSAIVYV